MDAPLDMSTEMVLLGWSVVLLLVYIVLQASAGAPELGPAYLFSPRDEERKPQSVYAGRLYRALWNFLETYPAFVALALALTMTGQTEGLGATGAQIWFWSRVAYLPIYLFGIPIVRTLVWALSIVGLVLMLIELLF